MSSLRRWFQFLSLCTSSYALMFFSACSVAFLFGVATPSTSAAATTPPSEKGASTAKSKNTKEIKTPVVEDHTTILPDLVAHLRNGRWDKAQQAAQRVHALKKNKQKIVQVVQDSVADTKKKADELLLYLNRQFAIPDELPCASRWAQNGTHVLLQVRFGKSWQGHSAHWGQRYSTKGGEGLIEQNAQGIQELLKMDLTPISGKTNHAFSLSIVGQIGTKRYKFVVPETELFAEVHSRFRHEISFRNAKGSMQMSRGAQLPELKLFFQKKVRNFFWSRFSKEEHLVQEYLASTSTTTTTTTTKKKKRKGKQTTATTTTTKSPMPLPEFSIGLLDVVEDNVEESLDLSGITPDVHLARNSGPVCAPLIYCPMTDMCVEKCELCTSTSSTTRTSSTSNKVFQGVCVPKEKPKVDCSKARFVDWNLQEKKIAGVLMLDDVLGRDDIWTSKSAVVREGQTTRSSKESQKVEKAVKPSLLRLDTHTQHLSREWLLQTAQFSQEQLPPKSSANSATTENEQNRLHTASSDDRTKAGHEVVVLGQEQDTKKLLVPPYVSRIGLEVENVPFVSVDLEFLEDDHRVSCESIPVHDRLVMQLGIVELNAFHDENPLADALTGNLTLHVSDRKNTHGVHVYFSRGGADATKIELPEPESLFIFGDKDDDGEKKSEQEHQALEAKQRQVQNMLLHPEAAAAVREDQEQQNSARNSAGDQSSPPTWQYAPGGMDTSGSNYAGTKKGGKMNNSSPKIMPALRFELVDNEADEQADRKNASPRRQDVPQAFSFSGGKVSFVSEETDTRGLGSATLTFRLENVTFARGATHWTALPYHRDVEGVNERSVALTDAQKPKRLAALVVTEDEYLIPTVVSVGLTPAFRDNSATGVVVYEAVNCEKLEKGESRVLQVDKAAMEKRCLDTKEAVKVHFEAGKDNDALTAAQKMYSTSQVVRGRKLTQSSHRSPLRYAGREVDGFLVHALNDIGESEDPFFRAGVVDKKMSQLDHGRKDHREDELKRYLKHAESLYVEKSKHYANAESLINMRQLALTAEPELGLLLAGFTEEENKAAGRGGADASQSHAGDL
ncbi:unnamed protein product [Amoebophrya sp. A120]|nr:unnamed protein product [Amoebophrya sp. A120]|eukprot:GSA120T00019968001.1